MNIYAISTLISSIAMFSVGLSVFLKDTSNKTFRLFFYSNLIIALWLFGCFGESGITHNVSFLAGWDKLFSVFAVFSPSVFVHIIFSILGIDASNKRLLSANYIISFFLLLTIPIGFFSAGIRDYYGVRYITVPGPAYYIFLWLFCWCGYLTLSRTFRELTNNPNLKRRIQLQYLLLAIATIISAASAYFVMVFGIFMLPIDGWLNIAYVSLLSYTITQHRLLGVDVVIRKGLLYAVITAFISSSYLTLLYLANAFFAAPQGIHSLWLIIIGSFAFSLVFQPFKDLAQEYIDKKFSKRIYEIDKIINKFSQGLKSLIALNDLAEFVNSTAFNTFVLKGSALFVVDREKRAYICMNAIGDLQRLTGKTIKASSKIVGSLMKTGSSVQSGRHLRVPVISEREGPDLSGFFVFSEKLSGEGFSGIDMTLMETFANHTAVSIENAILLENEKNAAKRLAQAQIMERVATIARINISLQHEINNPLTGALAQTQILAKEAKESRHIDAEKAVPMLSTIEKELLRIRGLLKNLEKITHPAIKEYLPGVEMIDIAGKTTTSEL